MSDLLFYIWMIVLGTALIWGSIGIVHRYLNKDKDDNDVNLQI